ncbi:sigma factor-like helix-turn-helix DNA-binding protein [Argonema antarcticum]|uniref:sigma factor-like helix-turn-helix DNA-binding protein n=1 Tax=Argonema antarcticum TaxID=2942763 RepID=UPI0020123CE3|nr:sigma factor-like helix-turn-helix DNA-binding protein [Argonema antarcticum]MCL1472878.1 hypothetical protein [Argonema antarcticum A004/B2]
MSNFFIKDSIPRLPERSNNIDRFSMYLMLDDCNERMVIQWKCRLHLKRNLELYEAEDPQFAKLCRQQDKGRGIAEYWVKVVQSAIGEVKSRKLALEHLAAYFESTCYQAAKKVRSQSSDRTWDEYLYIARKMVYNLDNFAKALEKYDKSQGANLDTYIQDILEKTIKSEVTVGKFSRWRLLYKKPDKDLKSALEITKHGQLQVSQYLFARKYFKQVYLINKVQNPDRQAGQKWPLPDLADFNEAAKYYNAEKSFPSAPHEVSASSGMVTGEKIKQWMENCIEALQKYSVNSINAVSIEFVKESDIEIKAEESNEIDSYSFWDAVECEDLINRTDVAFRSEIENIKAKVDLRIQQRKLQIHHKKIPNLYYGVGLTQTQIANILGINQGNIGRHLDSYYEVPLLEKLAAISQANEWVKPSVSRWLVKDYASPLHSDLIQAALVEAINKLTPEYREVLQLRYGHNLTENQISARYCIMEREVNQRINEAQICLESALLKVIEEWLDKYVKSWLYRFYKLSIYSALNSALANLSTDCKEVVNYRYYLRRTEEQTAVQLNLNGNQVNERIYLAKIQLRDSLLKWIVENLDVSLEKESELAKVNILVQEWLQNLYKSN